MCTPSSVTPCFRCLDGSVEGGEVRGREGVGGCGRV